MLSAEVLGNGLGCPSCPVAYPCTSGACRYQPFYNVLVDSDDIPFQTTYVAQENIQPSATSAGNSCPPVLHPEVSHIESITCLGYYSMTATCQILLSICALSRCPGHVAGCTRAPSRHSHDTFAVVIHGKGERASVTCMLRWWLSFVMACRWTDTLRGDVMGPQDMSRTQRSGTAIQMTRLSAIV